MKINSVKGDGLEHLLSPACIELWGWENLSMPLVPSGIDPDTGEMVYTESDRRVTGRTIEIELENDGDVAEKILAAVWFTSTAGTHTVGCSPKSIHPGQSEIFEIVLDESRYSIWCILRMEGEKSASS